MIHVTRLSGRSVVINGDLIEQIEATPDTVISLTTWSTLMVREPVQEIIRRVIEYRRAVFAPVAGGPAFEVSPES